MKMLSFMRSHSMDEWGFTHILLGVILTFFIYVDIGKKE